MACNGATRAVEARRGTVLGRGGMGGAGRWKTIFVPFMTTLVGKWFVGNVTLRPVLQPTSRSEARMVNSVFMAVFYGPDSRMATKGRNGRVVW